MSDGSTANQRKLEQKIFALDLVLAEKDMEIIKHTSLLLETRTERARAVTERLLAKAELNKCRDPDFPWALGPNGSKRMKQDAA